MALLILALLLPVLLLPAALPARAQPSPAEALALVRQADALFQAGRLDAAGRAAADALAFWEKGDDPEHPAIAGLLGLQARIAVAQGRPADAEPLLRRSLAVAVAGLGPDHPAVAATGRQLAELYRALGRWTEAEDLAKRSLTAFEMLEGPAGPSVAATLATLAEIYRLQGRIAAAEPLIRRNLAILEAQAGPDHPAVAMALNNLGLLYETAQRPREAEPLLRRALAIATRALGPEHADLAPLLNNLASVADRLDRLDEAAELYRRSLAIKTRALGADHPSVAVGEANLALVLARQGRAAEAEALARRGLAALEARLGPDHPEVAGLLSTLAALEAGQSRLGAAVALTRRAVAIQAARFARDPREADGGGAERRDRRFLFLQHVSYLHPEAGAAAIDESFQVAQHARASSAARAVAGMAARFAGGSDALAGTVRERQDLGERAGRLDAALVAAASEPPDRRDPAAETALRGQLAEAGARLAALDARLATEFPRYAEMTRPQPLPIAAAQALLGADEALLVTLVAADECWLWALRRDRAAWYRLALDGRTLAAEVSGLRSRLDPAANPGLAPFDAARAHALHQRLLAPAAALLDGAKHVLVVPDGALESLPIGVLVTRPPTADPATPADHRGIGWLARDHAVTVLPSVGALRALRTFAAATRATAPFAGIGDPTLDGAPGAARGVGTAELFRGALADVDAVRKLPPLPETADELRAVARALGADERDLFLGARAAEPVLRGGDLARYRIVHFATHGLTSGELRGLAEPALVLTPPAEGTVENDGLLTASEVAQLRLDADWVVLSACNTAAPDGTPDAGGLSGLARAFFHAGARALLVSHWSVPSQATVRLVTGAVEALARDSAIGRAEALRRAQLALLDDAGLPPDFAHPMAWAPFVLAGEGGAGR